jgi:hypothetical protein
VLTLNRQEGPYLWIRVLNTKIMKAKIYTPLLLTVFIASFGAAIGQTKTEKELKEEDLKKKQQVIVIGNDKKLTEEQLKKELEAVRSLQMDELKAAKEDQFRIQKEALDSYKKSMEVFKKQGIDNYYVVPPVGRLERDDYSDIGRHYNIWSLDENSTLSISKDLADVTTSNDFTYEIKQGTYSINFRVDGSLSSGEMKISFKKPDGKVFQEMVISPLADINWNQSFRWEEEDENDFLGKWTISIKADKAKGEYSVRVNSR